MPKSKEKIVSVGDIAADFLVGIPGFPLNGGDFVLTDPMQIEPGGSANFLIAAKRLGADIHAVGVLGNDLWGDQIESILQGEGIQMALVERQGTTTQVLVLIGGDQEHAFVGSFGQGSEVSFSQQHQELLAESAALFVTGYSLHEQRLCQLSLEMMAHAQQIGVPTYLDPGPAFVRLSDELQQQAVKLTQVLLMTENEIPLVELDEVPSLFNLGPSLLLIKMGGAGCRVYEKDKEFHSPGFQTTVVDTTAAGDSFDAGFIVARTQGLSLAEAAKYANAVGAAKVMKVGGGRNVPTYAEVESILTQYST